MFIRLVCTRIVLSAVCAPPHVLQFLLCLQGKAVTVSGGVQCELGNVREPGLRILLPDQGFLPSQARPGVALYSSSFSSPILQRLGYWVFRPQEDWKQS